MNAVALPVRSSRRRTTAAEPEPSQRVALVSGANRGLGLEVSRQLASGGVTVLLGARNVLAGEKSARQLRREGGKVVAVPLDVTSARDARDLAGRIEAEYGRLDILVNNAGAYFDIDSQASSANLDIVRQALETNLLGAWQVTRQCVQRMRREGK
jgi:NAD(P)-dependent dehydrogenase (short-subunit alcohol dehydrogenase family)